MPSDLTGTEILGFRLTKLLGCGGIASVWRAENRAIDKVVAVKVLDPLLADNNPQVRERFRIEARIQVKLGDHPHIVRVENFSMDPLATVMEYVEGRSLAEVIENEVGAIPIARALPWMRQVLSAIDYAHGQAEPVIHRDLKPSNIMLDANDTVKVVDFGIAKVAQAVQLTRTGATMGTAVYMAPEQFTGAGSVDARADIYSLGVTFYEMLAGRPPFEVDGAGDSDFRLKLAHMQEIPPDPRKFYPGIPAAAATVVLRCLEKDPDNRYQSIVLLQAALDQAAAGVAPGPSVAASRKPARAAAATVVEASPRPVTPGLQPPKTSPRSWAIISAVGGLVALASVLILLSHFADRSGTASRPDIGASSQLPAPRSAPEKKPPGKEPEVAAAVEIEFQPERISRAEPKPRRSKKSGPALSEAQKRMMAMYKKSGVTKKPSGPVLTKAQKRMMAMYKKSGGKPIPRVKGHEHHRQISGAEVAGQYRKYKKQFQACYQRALARDKKLTELKVDVTIDVSNMGRVRSVSFRSLPSKDLAGCLRRIIKRWAFKPSGEQTIAFPLVFRGAG